MTAYSATFEEKFAGVTAVHFSKRKNEILKAKKQHKELPKNVILTELDDADLMDRIKENDQLAYQVLVKRHFEKMYGLAFRMIQQAADAEDITQDVFFKLWTHRDKWVREGALVSTWLYRVTLNRCIDFKRKPQGTSLEEAPEPEDREPNAVTLIQRSQTSQMLKQASAKLSEQQQAALALFYQQELSNAEAAEVMGVSVNAMESLLKRARQKLREILKHSSKEMLMSVRE